LKTLTRSALVGARGHVPDVQQCLAQRVDDAWRHRRFLNRDPGIAR
jgi:hypothetical protein